MVQLLDEFVETVSRGLDSQVVLSRRRRPLCGRRAAVLAPRHTEDGAAESHEDNAYRSHKTVRRRVAHKGVYVPTESCGKLLGFVSTLFGRTAVYEPAEAPHQQSQ